MDNAIGNNIKAARKAMGLTQKELAERAGTAVGTIQQYELGKRQPRLEQLQNISAALGMSLYNLLPHSGKYPRRSILDELAALVEEGNIQIQVDDWDSLVKSYREGMLYDTMPNNSFHKSPPAKLLESFEKLNTEGQNKAIERVTELTEIPKYQKSPPDAQEAPSPSEGETTPENKKSPE